MRKSELFEAFDLFDVRDFGKVIETLSRLSRTPIALATGIRPFPTEESINDDDIYKGLPDLIEYVERFQQNFHKINTSANFCILCEW
ncbi:hypothetical protein MJG53_001746 [Ovis ammon polii x Ovis aries]|uniref:Uncharacterized protein n=1 Tax=Ovis ammon polii x Ovis aries TaxID=2918886 RepID=A0ACB9VLU3_9CETA|nr:hypothetical protein MJT46_001236 [Ovis ammon polii x Ovis aries]KAI4590697.1 hypothetical protein MJG53_001746 [Ovis ammon polii x Ovis aries]